MATGAMDWLGATLATLGLGFIVVALIEAPRLGGIAKYPGCCSCSSSGW